MKIHFLVIISIILFSTHAIGQDDAITKYFESYLENEDFSVVYLSPKLFQLVGKLQIDDIDDKQAEAILNIVEELESFRVLSSEKTIHGNKYFDEANALIQDKSYENLLTVRDQGEKVRFWIKDDGGDIINELLLLVGSEDEFSMVSFTGNIKISDIVDLVNQLDIDNLEHMEKLQDFLAE